MSRGKYRMRTLTLHEINIESLIPAAEKEAWLRVGNFGTRSEVRPGVDGRTYNHCFFTEFFHKAMTRLAIENGFRAF